jgi:hypothetical protein
MGAGGKRECRVAHSLSREAHGACEACWHRQRIWSVICHLEDEAPFASRGPRYPGRGGGQAMGCGLLATSTAISK